MRPTGAAERNSMSMIFYGIDGHGYEQALARIGAREGDPVGAAPRWFVRLRKMRSLQFSSGEAHYGLKNLAPRRRPDFFDNVDPQST